MIRTHKYTETGYRQSSYSAGCTMGLPFSTTKTAITLTGELWAKVGDGMKG
jgi:hypothetical protein